MAGRNDVTRIFDLEGASGKAALSINEVCDLTGFCRDVIYKAIRRGDLIAQKRGSRTVILPSNLQVFLKGLPRLDLGGDGAANQHERVDELIEAFGKIADRAELAALMAPLRLPYDLPESQRARITDALIAAAARCWRGRSS
jgi:hypothetical protein